jgi:ribonuclease T2
VRLVGFLAALFLAAAPARAGGTPGDFDFYVLSLSWSPTYCATDSHPDSAECGGHFGFIVHGLWPEYESGHPSSCATNMPLSVRQATIDGLADIMPSGGLIVHEWRTHGVCSGLTQDAYFTTLRRAFEKVSLPGTFSEASRDANLSPREIEQAFIATNPRLIETEIAVTCTRGLLDEVRICLTKDLEFRRCPEVDRQSCRVTNIKVPAAR